MALVGPGIQAEGDRPENVDGLVDGRRLAKFLGIDVARISEWRARGVDYLPEPVGDLKGPVWRLEDLEGIKERVGTRRKGRPKKSTSDRDRSRATPTTTPATDQD